MGERLWTIIGAVTGAVVMLFWVPFILIMLAASIYVLVAGTLDVWRSYNDGQPTWVKVAVLLIFIRTFLNQRRLERIEKWVEHIRMSTLGLMSYFDVSYGNERLDLLVGIGPLTKHSYWRIWARMTASGDFADDVLNASYAKRDGRRVTLTDDLKLH